MPFVFAIFFLVYLLGLFPFAYFRHDDWLIIGDGFRGAGGWVNYFKPLLWVGDEHWVWFFRPFFKWIAHEFFELFGFRYFWWLFFQLGILTLAIGFLAKTVEGVTGSRAKGWQFAALVCASWQLHVGSLLWVGEGLMNCPQLLFQAICLWAFWRYEAERKLGWYGLSLAAFFLSLFVKESSVFLVALLAAMVWCEPPWRGLSLKNLAQRLGPFAVVSAVYLVFRLGVLPYNTSYVIDWNLNVWLRSIVYLAGTLGLAVAGWWALVGTPTRAELSRRWIYLPFLAVSVAPYLGHPFFSPGWLLFPGFLLLFTLFLIPRPEPKRAWAGKVALGLCVLTLGLSLMRLRQFDWWRWERSQRAFTELAIGADTARFDRIDLEVCPNPEYPQANISRVFGQAEQLQSMLHLVQKKPMQVRLVDCRSAVEPGSERVLRVGWHYPDLVRHE